MDERRESSPDEEDLEVCPAERTFSDRGSPLKCYYLKATKVVYLFSPLLKLILSYGGSSSLFLSNFILSYCAEGDVG